MLSEFQTKKLKQCLVCKTWRNKFVKECNSKECTGTAMKRITKKHPPKEIVLRRRKMMKKLKQTGITNRAIADMFGYASESSVRKQIALLD